MRKYRLRPICELVHLQSLMRPPDRLVIVLYEHSQAHLLLKSSIWSCTARPISQWQLYSAWRRHSSFVDVACCPCSSKQWCRLRCVHHAFRETHQGPAWLAVYNRGCLQVCRYSQRHTRTRYLCCVAPTVVRVRHG